MCTGPAFSEGSQPVVSAEGTQHRWLKEIDNVPWAALSFRSFSSLGPGSSLLAWWIDKTPMEVGGRPTERKTLSVTTVTSKGGKRGKKKPVFHPPGIGGKSRRALGLGHIMDDLAQISIWIKSSLCPSFSVSFLYHQLISLLDHSNQHINVL